MALFEGLFSGVMKIYWYWGFFFLSSEQRGETEEDLESVITVANFPWQLSIVTRCYNADDQNKPLSTKKPVMKP